MSGSITTRQNIQTLSANRIIVEFGGQQIGLIQSCSPSDDYGLEPATQIGDIHVQEHVPTLARHRLSIRGMTLIKKTMRSVGMATVNGDDALKGLVFDVCFYSRDSLECMRRYISCSWASGDADITANRIVTQSGSLMALDVTGTGI